MVDQLLNLLEWHRVHRRPAGCLHDRLRIIGIVPIGFYELGINQLHRMTAALENSRPEDGDGSLH